MVTGLNGDHSPPEKVVNIMSEIRILQEIITKFKALMVDPTEYACLKGIVIFKTVFPNAGSEMKSLRDFHTIAGLQDQAQVTLSKYIQGSYPSQPFRFGKLLLLLPTLRSISGNTIEELFFRKTIGNIPIERLLVDMYKSSDF
uniref:NR LBD domain-containing protein n=1 Tax=Octopus bimaculoides TaxID=37653 RepID=A0A0L8GWU3_OCTBM